MRFPTYTKQFKKDLKIMDKRGKALSKIKKVLRKLVNEERL
jgi:mRNA-degrading endonuclease YafQ of YafQ-DinJ toxin-antitoxin module